MVYRYVGSGLAWLLGCVRFSSRLSYWIYLKFYSRRRYKQRPRSRLATGSVPGVSILRPLKGLDTNLYENLESSFTQEYPNFEILLSVAHEDDQALPVVRELMAKYPHVDAKVIVGASYYLHK